MFAATTVTRSSVIHIRGLGMEKHTANSPVAFSVSEAARIWDGVLLSCTRFETRIWYAGKCAAVMF